MFSDMSCFIGVQRFTVSHALKVLSTRNVLKTLFYSILNLVGCSLYKGDFFALSDGLCFLPLVCISLFHIGNKERVKQGGDFML
jgi:hypothetical protein